MKKNDNLAEYVAFFRQSSPYIHAHRGKTFVITLSGETLAHDNLDNIINDIALMSSLGVRLVLVHGARPQINERLKERGIISHFHNQRRITSRKALESVKDAVGNLRALIEARLSVGLVNSPMHGARIQVVSGNFVTAKPLGVLDGIDFKHTGEVRRLDDQAISHLLDSGYVVLLSCLGLSPTGESFNMEAEEVATEAAVRLRAEKLILYGQEAGLFNEQGQLINRISPSEAERQLDGYSGESRRLLASAVKACHEGVERTQIISYQDDGSLLMELFTRDGVGTLISRGHYEEMRSATIEDVAGILALIHPFEEKGILRRRSRKELEREIHLFSVVLLDGMIIGCAALHPFYGENGGKAELACLVVHPAYQRGNRGDRLMTHIEKSARDKNITQVYVMTTQASHWFIERGFESCPKHDIPEEVLSRRRPERQSRVLTKML